MGAMASPGRRLPPGLNVQVAYTPGGKYVTCYATIAVGRLRITDTYQAVYLGDELTGSHPADAYVLTLREAYLDGQPVLDPDRARALAEQAGLADPADPSMPA